MGEEYVARTFRSGNSVALRLPKGLGLKEGEEVAVVPHRDGSFTLWRRNDAAAVLDALYGAFSPGFMSGGRGSTEQDDRDWSKPAQGEAA